MRYLTHLLACLAGLLAVPANAAIFSFDFAFPAAGIAEVPGSTLLASNQVLTTEVRVPVSTRLSLFRLRQSNSDTLLDDFAPSGADVDLVLGSNRFEIDDQAFDFAGQLIATFAYQGDFQDALGLVFDDAGTDVFTYYPDLPFEFYVDGSATFDGIGPFVGSSNVIYFTVLPGSGNRFLGTGLYRLQGAIPEPAAWAMMIGGFCLVGVSARKRRRTAAIYA